MTSNHVSGLFFLSCPQNPSINHLNFHCIKQIDNIFPCVCTVIDHRRCHSVQRTTVTQLDVVLCRTFLFFTRCDVICDLLQYTRSENVIYLWNTPYHLSVQRLFLRLFNGSASSGLFSRRELKRKESQPSCCTNINNIHYKIAAFWLVEKSAILM